MFDINGWELIIIGLLAVILIGPDRLPEYVTGLKGVVKQVRALLKQGKNVLNEEFGGEEDWRQYDPRQYDPRRIVREALAEPDDDASPVRASRVAAPAADAGAGAGTSAGAGAAASAMPGVAVPDASAPFDPEST